VPPLAVAGAVAGSPMPESRDFEVGRGIGQLGTGIVQVVVGGGMVLGGGAAAGGGAVGAPATGGLSLVLSGAGVGVAAQGLVVGTVGAANAANGINTLMNAANMSGTGSGGGGAPPPESRGVEIVDARGSPLGELDHVQQGKFVEDKSAHGLLTPHPKTGLPQQTADEWAQRQIFKKTQVRIENLKQATATRPTPHGSPTVPSLQEIKGIRHIEFRVESSTPAVQAAVEKQLAALRSQNPGWTFTATYGP
jgi:hypothetical protein